MTQACVTVVFPFPAARESDVNAVLDGFGNPAQPPCALPLNDAAFVHFMSMVVVPTGDEQSAHLVIEVCADGQPRAALERLVETIPDALLRVLAATGNGEIRREQLGTYLEEKRIEVGSRWLATPGLTFAGTPGMTVSRIKGEARLASRIRELLDELLNDEHRAPGSARAQLEQVRRAIFSDIDLKWAFVSEPVPLLGDAKPWSNLLKPLLVAAWRDFLWMLIPLPVLVALYFAFVAGRPLDIVCWDLVLALGIELLLVGIAFALGYRKLQRQEKDDIPIDVEPPLEHVQRIMERENLAAQNHLTGISILKPGLVRRVTLRIALWLIGELATHLSQPGFLNKIGTIHFARWVLLPGTDRLVFLSNYDGSWQSYLEDFIARLHDGLSSIWSNTRDFPRTANLIVGGASDGTRFKRWARRQQVPTRFWYSAYPDLTTSRIRANAAIRHGFASASSESEAATWLALFGYALPETVESEEIPTLVFGGLSPLRFAHCLIVRLGQPDDARRWLREIGPDICYGERPPERSALVVAFTCGGMRKLGLDDWAIATFPTAFQHGMSAPARARALGDDPGRWSWGGTGTEVDAVLMLYAATDDGLRAQIEKRKRQLREFECSMVKEVRLGVVPEIDPVSKRREIREPFGFRDGISQPIMRGSRNWSKAGNKLHAVEPGELVLGYRDNLGNAGPSPCSKGRDIGRNGTFLVVRQLEQDKACYEKYLVETARALAADTRVPRGGSAALEHWIAAKMLGRWKDGSSLVRHPEGPGTAGSKPRFPDNDFLFGRDDPDGLRCPLGAHIRRANPRDSFEPGSELQIAITNRHRILRVGRSYEPENGAHPGLLFMCVNADIERQFEFLQQTWLLGPSFHGLENEIDPIGGYRGAGETMTVPTPGGPVRLKGLQNFITVRGGGYFFVPGKSAVGVLTR